MPIYHNSLYHSFYTTFYIENNMFARVTALQILHWQIMYAYACIVFQISIKKQRRKFCKCCFLKATGKWMLILTKRKAFLKINSFIVSYF